MRQAGVDAGGRRVALTVTEVTDEAVVHIGVELPLTTSISFEELVNEFQACLRKTSAASTAQAACRTRRGPGPPGRRRANTTEAVHHV